MHFASESEEVKQKDEDDDNTATHSHATHLLGVGSFWKACHELGLDTGKVACSLCLGTACFPTPTPDFRHEMWRGKTGSKVWDSSDNGDQQMIKKEDLLADFKRRTSKLSRVQCGREIRHQPR